MVGVAGDSASVGLHGVCTSSGECFCDPFHFGPNCSHVLNCSFWDESSHLWGSRGCITRPTIPVVPFYLPNSPMPIYADAVLVCECSHLTEFCGIEVRGLEGPRSGSGSASGSSVA